jgi:transcriptional regulator with XRE-family HTH domain
MPRAVYARLLKRASLDKLLNGILSIYLSAAVFLPKSANSMSIWHWHSSNWLQSRIERVSAPLSALTVKRDVMMRKILDAKNPKVVQAVEVIARRAPGFGSAFRDLRKLAGLSQAAVAKALEVNSAAVSHWESNRHCPTLEVLRRALFTMHVDVRLLQEHFGADMTAYVSTDTKEAAFKVAEVIVSMKDANLDEIEAAMFDRFGPMIIAAQVKKALDGDTKAAEWVLQRNTRRRMVRNQTSAQTNDNGADSQTATYPIPCKKD